MKETAKLKIFLRPTFVITLLIIVSGLLYKHGQNKPFDSYKIIAHGLGGLPNEKRVTNSIEAFKENYKKGTRVFEVDLIETSDGYLVARHDWLSYLYDMLEQTQPVEGEECVLTLEEFKEMLINKYYQPATLDDLLDLMIEYPDIYLVTDTKTTTSEDTSRVFQKIVSAVEGKNSNLLKRIYPQIYNQDSYYALKKVYPFENILYTVYYETATKEEILNFSIKENIKGIVMPDYFYTPEYASEIKAAGIDVYVHTINNLDEIENYLSESVTGVYSDYVAESHIGMQN